MEPGVAPAQLVADIKADVAGLVTDHVELARLEMQDSAKQGGIGAGLLAGAGALAVTAFLLLSMALGYGLAVAFGAPTWVGFVIVGVLYLLLAGLLGMLGQRRLKRLTPPTRAVESMRATLAALQRSSAQPGR
jgi:hypothetical protein